MRQFAGALNVTPTYTAYTNKIHSRARPSQGLVIQDEPYFVIKKTWLHLEVATFYGFWEIFYALAWPKVAFAARRKLFCKDLHFATLISERIGETLAYNSTKMSLCATLVIASMPFSLSTGCPLSQTSLSLTTSSQPARHYLR